MGGREPVVSDDDILNVIRNSEDPVLSAKEISDEISIGSKGVYRRLRELEEEGQVVSKMVGRTRIWWIPSDGTVSGED